MILIDGVGHIVSDRSIEELHSFASSMGLKREWYQDKRIPHYDATTNVMKRKAHILGAQFVSSRGIVRRAVRNSLNISL